MKTRCRTRRTDRYSPSEEAGPCLACYLHDDDTEMEELLGDDEDGETVQDNPRSDMASSKKKKRNVASDRETKRKERRRWQRTLKQRFGGLQKKKTTVNQKSVIAHG